MTLRLSPHVYKTMIGHSYDGLPDEACGLIAAAPGSDKAVVVYPTRNAAASSRVYEVDPLDLLKADRDAEARGLQLAGVFHSHTHTDAYPSPTDQAQAPDPEWHYILVSLKDLVPVVRSYRIVDGNITEEPLVLEGR
ncbi:MAG: [CysO sulfur-carrier protein]-S-L-cysteine hydrolase [Actinomycetota bacterium]|jgi:proteasome lid subunit RPN8/RPN11